MVGARDLWQDGRSPRLRQLLVAQDRPAWQMEGRVRRAVRHRPRVDADRRPGDGPIRFRCLDGQAKTGRRDAQPITHYVG